MKKTLLPLIFFVGMAALFYFVLGKMNKGEYNPRDIPTEFIGRAAPEFALPDLFAGKMHAVLCRKWKTRVKGRDWYDLVWYAANHPQLHLSHLEQRMRQSGHWKNNEALSAEAFKKLMHDAIERLPVDQARREVEPFVSNPDSLEVWSRNFFRSVVSRIRFV